ncbi:MAG: sulfate permease [Candidatus Accumulibacter phosphatis]|jgi:SulP family sulfate permease|uniref:SulP family inorganic anion transporter n=2 Tax=Candidatus Accumulibacter TaxID=327159 RepID=A0ABX1T4W8_9PROT|nr:MULTISPECIES: sulfate permease [Candidatus Accumulibacter]KFB71354.1 MAG: putative sulfate transporterc [Candidatus Accumulibacter phosphatis]MBL8406992.1 SulP family inorganic anion transporter [Accumulibacter sp.]NMQ04153.1 SulP family inorganic anion transporter [Candidatus Accumulibacter contiguus]HRF11617.1 sulfate permease [Candidatus Accumulibacter phosphatis]
MNPASIFKYLQSGLPLITTLREYRIAWLSKDAIAGLSACIVSIPSVIAYAELVHLPAITGLYAALAAAVGYALFASSRHVIAGPDAAIGLLAGSAILPLAAGDPSRIVTLAAVLSILSGAVLLLAARLKLGVIADLLSRPVLIGYLNGASLVLIATQLGKMFRIKTEGEEFFELVYTVIGKLPETHLMTFLFGLCLVGFLLALTRWAPRVPGALAVCAVAIVVSFVLDLGSYGVALVGEVPSGVPSLTIPHLQWGDISALAPAAVAIAFLAFSDGILLAQTFAEKNGYEIRPNRELVALGSSNILAGLWQGFPVSASQSRTSIVDSAGGKSQVAQLVVALGLLLFLLFLTGLIALLPKVALGAILIVTAMGMLEVASLSGLYKVDRVEFAIAMGVTLAILIAGVVPGIILGLLLSLISVLVEVSRPGDAVLRRRLDDGRFHDCRDDEAAESVPGLLVYRLYAPLNFANARHVMTRIRTLVDEADPPVKWLVIDAQALHDMDVTAAQRFAELHRELAEEGVDVKIADAPRPFLEELAKVGLSEEIGRQDFFVSVKKAAEAFDQYYAVRDTKSHVVS